MKEKQITWCIDNRLMKAWKMYCHWQNQGETYFVPVWRCHTTLQIRLLYMQKIQEAAEVSSISIPSCMIAMGDPLTIILQRLCIAYQQFLSNAHFICTDLNAYSRVSTIIHKCSWLCNNPILQITFKLESVLLLFNRTIDIFFYYFKGQSKRNFSFTYTWKLMFQLLHGSKN